MKKILWLLVSVLILSTTVTTFADKVIYGDGEQLSNLKNHSKEIKELTYHLFGEGGETIYDATENAEEVAEILSEVELQEKVDMEATDSDEFFHFIFDDGTEIVFWFNGGNLRFKNTEADGYVTYKVSGFEKFHIEKYGVEMMETEE